MLICVVLIIGGVILYAIDRMPLKPIYRDVMDYPPSLAFKIGLFQCLAMIPGTSRSGATIAGALLMGTDKRSAAEFSFFLAMPTMLGAFTLDLYKNRAALDFNDATLIAVGFIAAFVSALLVVRSLLNFVSSRGFAPFAIWRILVGTAGLIGLWLFG
jgi:undecaprenyl-diphosphatase